MRNSHMPILPSLTRRGDLPPPHSVLPSCCLSMTSAAEAMPSPPKLGHEQQNQQVDPEPAHEVPVGIEIAQALYGAPAAGQGQGNPAAVGGGHGHGAPQARDLAV